MSDKKSDKKPEFTHPLVHELVKDPAQPPTLVVLTGYLGPSDEDDKIRLYRSQTLSTWVDIPRGQVVYARRTDRSGQNPWGEDYVWIAAPDASKLPPERTGEVTASTPDVASSAKPGGTWGDWPKGSLVISGI